jgi:hypothetical protein
MGSDIIAESDKIQKTNNNRSFPQSGLIVYEVI